MRKAAFTAFGVCVASGLLLFAVSAQAAGNAALSLSPANGSYAAGSTFTLNVVVDSGGGLGVNAASGQINFDPTVLSAQSVSKDNSIFNLWVADPTFSNTNGTVSFSGGGTTAYTGNSGVVMSVTFKVLKAGAANLSFSGASVLAADGQGTDVLGTTGTGSFTLGGAGSSSSANASTAPASSSGQSSSQGGGQASSAPAPSPFEVTIAVASPTHPDQTKWYADDNPNFTWQLTPDVAGVSTVFGANAGAYPKRSSEGLISSKQYSGVSEGVSYFNVRFEDSLGDWSDPVTYKVQIDVTPPEPFTVNVEPGAGLNGRTLLAFNATDTVSGIDHYEMTIDGGSSTTIALTDLENGVYTMPPVLAGSHTVIIRAVDRAGNYAEAHTSFSVPGIAMPTITNFPATVIEKSPIVLEGTADSGANVTVDVNDAGDTVVAEGKMVADQTGHWLYAIEGGLSTGKYGLGVSMVTTQGAVASSTEALHLDVLSAPFLDRFGWAVIVLLLSAIAGLITFGFYRKKIMEMQFALAKRETKDVADKTKAVFEALREEVEENVSHMEGGAAQAQGETKLEPEHVLDAMRNALAVSESTIQKEVDDVERALKGE